MKKGYVKVVNSAVEFEQIIQLMNRVEIEAKNIHINPNFNDFAATLQSGDVVVVKSLDTFGSITKLLSQTIALFKENITIQSIDEPWYSVTPNQIEFLQGINNISRKLRSTCTRQGLDNAKAGGKKLGRPVGTTQYNREVAEVKRLCNNQGLSVAKACKAVGCQPRTYYRYLEKINIQ